MAFTISPGVSVSEVDLTTVVPSVLTTAGAYAGAFQWGPANTRIQVTSEIDLVNYFGEPDSNTANSFFTAASFLAYGNNLQVVRATDPTCFNADNGSGSNINMPNKSVFQATYLNQNNNNAFGAFMARYPGALGNSLQVSVVDAGLTPFSSWTYANLFPGAPSTSVGAANVGATNDEMHIVVPLGNRYDFPSEFLNETDNVNDAVDSL